MTSINLSTQIKTCYASWESDEGLQTVSDHINELKKFPKEIRDNLSAEVKISLLRAGQLRKKLKKTHYVFIHSQTNLEFFTLLLERSIKGSIDPYSTDFSKEEHKDLKVDAISKRGSAIKPTTQTHGNALLSVDANFFNTRDRLSQSFYQEKNLSRYAEYYPKAAENRLISVLKAHKLDDKTIESTVEKIKEFVEKDSHGILWAVAISKDEIKKKDQNLCYPSTMDGEYNHSSDFLPSLKKSLKSKKNMDGQPIFQLIGSSLAECSQAAAVCCTKGKFERYLAKAIEIADSHLVHYDFALLGQK